MNGRAANGTAMVILTSIVGSAIKNLRIHAEMNPEMAGFAADDITDALTDVWPEDEAQVHRAIKTLLGMTPDDSSAATTDVFGELLALHHATYTAGAVALRDWIDRNQVAVHGATPSMLSGVVVNAVLDTLAKSRGERS